MADGAVIGNLTIPVIKGDKGDKGNTGEIISISLVLLSPSSTAYAINNGSTTQAQIELGIPKGLSVSTTNINASGELVFTFNDNSTVNVGQVVGKGISEVTVTDDFDFVVTYTDGTSVTACNLEEEILGAINDILESYYTKTEIDEMGFITKEVNNLTNYYKKDETYTKQEVDNKVASVYKYKGTVATYADLPSSDLTIGDVYNVEDTGDNYAWTGTDWDKLGGNIDLSGYQEKIDNSHKLNADLVDDTSTTHKFTSTSEKNSWNAKYNKPSGGIPSTDMSSGVQASLEKAETAIQDVSGKEDKSNKTGILDENSTDTQYPNAKTVYDNFVTRDEEIEKLQTENAQLLADHPDILDENNEFPSGTDITLQGTGDLKMKVDVGGNSTQIQYEGYNKFILPNNSTIAGVQLTKNEDGSVTVNGTAIQSENFFVENKTLQAGNYTLQCKYEGILPTGGNARCQIYSPNASLVVSIPNEAENNRVNNATLSTDLTDIQFRIRVEGGFTYNNVKLYPLLVSGTYTSDTIPDFEPYVGNQASPNPTYKQDINNVEGNVVVKGSSKNLLNGSSLASTVTNNITFTNLGNSRYKLKGTASSQAEFYLYYQNDKPLYLKAGQYTFSAINLDSAYIVFSGSNYNGISYGELRSSTPTKTVTATSDNVMNYVVLRVPSGATIDTEIILQVQEGLNYIDTQEHKENTVTFPLSQGQKLMLGDTLEDDGIHHKREQITLNGTENWTKYSDNEYYVAQGKGILDNSKAGTSYIYGFCNKVTNDNDGRLLFNIIKKTTNTGGIDIQQLSSYWGFTGNNVTDFKSWLSQNPIIIEYELAEETIEPYTSAQQTAYNKLKEMQSYYDLTYVVGSSDNAQPILTVQAKKSLKVINDEISNINSRLTLLEE